MQSEKTTAKPERLHPRPTGQHRGAFTAYVRQLEPGRDPAPETFAALWQALRAAVVYELRRRGLWSASPAYLGVHGWRSWQDEPGTSGPTGPLEELLVDCYSFVFLSRLPRLKAHLRSKDNIEGLAFRSIRNFLHNRQRRSDPLGIRTFELVRSALGGLIDAGELLVLEGDPRVRGDTLLATPLLGTEEPAGGAELTSAVTPWANDLLPGLVTASGRGRKKLVESLQGHVREMVDAGVGTFRVWQVAEPLKVSVRACWAALLDAEAGETALEDRGELTAVVRLCRPGFCERLEAEDHFAHLVRCVEGRVARLEDDRTRQYLAALWSFLQVFAAGEDLGAKRGQVGGRTSRDGLPSHRQLSALLGIPRERLAGLLATLGGLIRCCQRALSESAGGARMSYSRVSTSGEDLR